jgi:RNA polymerase sigma-70 factor (ECF subfamily)
MDGTPIGLRGWTAHTVGSPSAPLRAQSPPREEPGAMELARVHRAGEGEPQAQAWLLTRVLPRVRRIARTLLGSPSDADDAAQIAALAVLRSAPTYRGEAAIEAWAGRIAVRAALRFIARERRERAAAATEITPEVDEPAALPEPPSEALPRDVREYLALLPEAQRNTVLLHHALDHSIDEIAELTEVSPDTVKSRIKLGMAALRKQIRQDLAIGRRRSS